MRLEPISFIYLSLVFPTFTLLECKSSAIRVCGLDQANRMSVTARATKVMFNKDQGILRWQGWLDLGPESRKGVSDVCFSLDTAEILGSIKVGGKLQTGLSRGLKILKQF